MTTIKLPPLPDKAVIDRHLPTGVQIRGYTAKQMRAYGEACARAALSAAADEMQRWQRDEREHGSASEYASGRLAGLHDAAAWLRARALAVKSGE